ncbi:Sulfatase-modifying factor enzyme 1 [Seminavis robusta]|uniref:Sulfatase-modifying factor enzyme 1 n=1 Tax=Seminavis robusta TaxID=568900 RepID=A0A9N8DQV6_9STRA|nr:Sulfatase-modifying factor enzyme 1 [Seminavis robusta]|eukprot:Sro290_g109320.1 Sulfatase-modifying factor enzyme 1 (463) ;mRNA; f:42351-44309
MKPLRRLALAEFAVAEDGNAGLVEELLSDTALLKKMLVADGAKEAQDGSAMKIYKDILQQRESREDSTGILDRLALAIALEHAVPMQQTNPKENASMEVHVDPVKRYLNYEMAYLSGELVPSFEALTVWDLRFVVDRDEPDEIAEWGRNTCRNFCPDHVLTPNEEWRYGNLVRIRRFAKYQNILMNGGICGRRAWFGRFILRAFGIPTTARPTRGNGALCRWTRNDGWVTCLGPGWGAGWTKTIYKQDVDFLATTGTQARANPAAYGQVKRAQWMGYVVAHTSMTLTRTSLGRTPRTEKLDIESPGHQEYWRLFTEIEYNEDGSILIPAVAVPRGTKDNTEETRFACMELPQHEVAITRGFYIGKYPVTQAQYEAIAGNIPSKSTTDPDCPVDNIGEDMALDFCREVTVLTGREIRLPTEAEWEYACRAPVTLDLEEKRATIRFVSGVICLRSTVWASSTLP